MDGPWPEGLVDEWYKFFQSHPDLKKGEFVYPDIFANGTLFPLQRMNETKAMFERAAKVKPSIVMEIGADKGGSLFHWCMLPSVEKVIACEIRGTPYYTQFERFFPDIKFLWLPVSSYAPMTVQVVKNWLGGNRIDCLFIDGDKSFFTLDWELYSPLTSKLVFIHDIQDDGLEGNDNPRQAYDMARSQGYRCDKILDRLEVDESLLREQNGQPPLHGYDGWLRYWKGTSCGVGVVTK